MTDTGEPRRSRGAGHTWRRHTPTTDTTTKPGPHGFSPTRRTPTRGLASGDTHLTSPAPSEMTDVPLSRHAALRRVEAPRSRDDSVPRGVSAVDRRRPVEVIDTSPALAAITMSPRPAMTAAPRLRSADVMRPESCRGSSRWAGKRRPRAYRCRSGDSTWVPDWNGGQIWVEMFC